MTLRARRILYINSIAIFLIIAPPLVLYTAGWRYDFTYNRLVETGSLVIKSNPEKANIALAGKPRKETTPAIINDILPGKINLVISKEGYHPWQRTVTVTPRVTTFVENIKLFRQSSPETLLPGPIKQYWWNKKQDKIAYLTKSGELRLYNTLNSKDSLLLPRPQLTVSPAVIWSPHDDQLLVNNLVLDANFPEKNSRLDGFTYIQWDPASPDTLYGLAGGALYRLPFRLAESRLILSGPIKDYTLSYDRIVWLESQGLSWLKRSDPNAIYRLPLPAGTPSGVFASTNSHLFSLFNQSKKTLFIADPAIVENTARLVSPPARGLSRVSPREGDQGGEGDETVIKIDNIQKSIWTHDGSRLVYTDGSAIYQRYFTDSVTNAPAEKTTQLITRYSEPVTDIFWSDDELYLFYIIRNRLNVLEANPSFTPFSLELLNSDSNLKQPEFIGGQQTVMFIDDDGALQSLPVAAKESRTFFFGD